MSYNTYFSDRGRFITTDAIFNLSHLTKYEKKHLVKVYLTLAYASLVTFISLAIPGPWVNLPSFFGFIFFIGSFLYLSFNNTNRYNEDLDIRRLVALTVLSVGQAILIRDFVYVLLDLHPDIIKMSLIGSVTIFTCFSLSSLMMQTRLWMYIGSLSSSALSYIVMVTFFNRFFRSAFVDHTLSFISLFVYVGFIIFDTQITLKDFNNGNKDYIMHAVSLYVDLIGLFIKLAKILYQKQRRDDKKRKSR